MDSIEAQFVRDTIAKNKVAIFSKTTCPYCTMAKEVKTTSEELQICAIILIYVLFHSHFAS